MFEDGLHRMRVVDATVTVGFSGSPLAFLFALIRATSARRLSGGQARCDRGQSARGGVIQNRVGCAASHWQTTVCWYRQRSRLASIAVSDGDEPPGGLQHDRDEQVERHEPRMTDDQRAV